MPLVGRIGNIREISRNERKLGFEWKIPYVISKLGNVGGKYTSPFFSALGSKFFLTISARRSVSEMNKKIILGLARTTWQTRVHYAVSIKKADDIEEEIVHDDILPAIESSDVKRFLQTSKITVNMSQIAPFGTLIVICTLWIDERFSGVGKTVVSRKMQFAKGFNTSAREVVRANPDIKEWFNNDSQMSWKTASSCAENERRPTDINSNSSQMSWDTESCITEWGIQPSECLSSSSQMSWKTCSSREENKRQSGANSQGCQTSSSQVSSKANGTVTDEKRQSTGCQSSSSQMSSEATGSVTDENRQTTDGVQNLKNNVRNKATKGHEIEILQYGMSFISDNIQEILTTRGWQNLIQRDPIRANQLLIKALERNANKS